jgi:hypothetical protein
VREQSTCGLFTPVQGVWSPNGPQQQAPRTPPAPPRPAADPVTVLEVTGGRRPLREPHEAPLLRHRDVDDRQADEEQPQNRHHRTERPAGISPTPPVSAPAENSAMRNLHPHSALSNYAVVPPAEPERCGWLMIKNLRTADAKVLRRRPRWRAHHARKVADVTDRRHQPRQAGTTELLQVSMITGGHNYGV